MAQTQAGAFVAATLEDAVKAGIGGAGLGTVGAATLTHTPLTAALGFGAAFLTSILLSLASQPFGDKGTNHVLAIVEDAGQQLLAAVVADVAAGGAQVAQQTPVEAYPAPTPTLAVLTAEQGTLAPQATVQAGVPAQP